MKKPLPRRARATIPAMPRPLPARRDGPAARRLRRGLRPAVALVVLGLLATACGSSGPAPTPPSSPSAVSPSPSVPIPASASPGTPASSPSPSPSPAASVDTAALFGQIEDEVIALRGLPAWQRLVPTILDEAQVRVRLEAQFRAENPPAEIAASQATLIAMGLLPPGTSLESLYVNLLGSQVGGYYDPATKQIYVVAGS